MIVNSDIVRLGFADFDRRQFIIDDINRTSEDLKASAYMKGELDYDEWNPFMAEDPSYRYAPITEFDRRVIKNYYLLFSALNFDSLHAEKALSLGADPNVQCLVGGRRYYPLIAAATSGDSETVKVLVENGADVNIQQLNGECAVALASSFDHYDMARYLLEHGANPNLEARGGITALAVAENSNMVKLLLAYGADPNIPDSDGDLPIVARIDNDDFLSAGVLVQAGTDLDWKNHMGESARERAIRVGSDLMRRVMGCD
ncbi:Ribulose-5-phosphate 4-epimerase and related epimerases and aldolases [Slackia heliotrinireducens]|uniref:Ankyrin repeat-containing protein n=1 Tax=Slackia heliotrinireducens (strain ATCC 29202 / DSM 20476 / NCTC 11029 / RHS 1) TaxID=471855 RepID=C7N4S4_SLAHD|nr:ankyrin repeat domain-containing protein [Slackia heliotrinireducens]ACV21909.1 ankyrin repeat-containing protein [Slackia heliotrinireducens DSM 20476]VEG99716.1 Ribulose-5-phosphate 4-epimerase and related epimerases and aldolases [Slackia heliotrinireducens]